MSGDPWSWYAVAETTTAARRPTEMTLEESEARNRLLVEYAPEAVLVLDADAWRFVDANGGAAALFGLPREELFAHDPVTLSPGSQPDGRPSDDAARDHVRRVLADGSTVFDWTHLTDGGVPAPCEVRLVRLPSADRGLVRASIVRSHGGHLCADLERHLAHLQHVESLGQVAARVAHDFNNILGVVGMASDLLLDAAPADSPHHEDVQAIRTAVARGQRLTEQILGYARMAPSLVEPFDVAAAVRDVCRLFTRLLAPHVTLVERTDGGHTWVRADRAELERVVANLILNARDAMPDGGGVTVTTTRVGHEVVVRVADRGVGMDPATLARIFDPYFTTKAAGHGTGLGLATVKRVVERHGGRIVVASEPGRGTTFDVVLPAWEG